jgi:hypothetical protein
MPPKSLPSLQRTDQLKANFATILGYGPARGGKTRSVEEMYKQGLNPVIIATELGETSGLLSLASSPISFIKVTSHTETMEVLSEMKRKPGKVEYQQTEFGAVILDSITQWGDWPLERYVEMKGWDDLHGGMEKGKDPRAAYGFLAEKGKSLYKELFALHAHLYVIAREGIFGEKETGFFHAPELPGQKLPREIPGWPDATVRLRVIAGDYRMITKGEGATPAGIRLPSGFPELPSRCYNNIPALIRYMCGDQSAFSLLAPEKKTFVGKPALATSKAS